MYVRKGLHRLCTIVDIRITRSEAVLQSPVTMLHTNRPQDLERLLYHTNIERIRSHMRKASFLLARKTNGKDAYRAILSIALIRLFG